MIGEWHLGGAMRKPRLIPSIWTAMLVMVTTARTCIQCILMSRVTRNKQYTLKHARESWAPSMFWVSNAQLEVIDEQQVDYTQPHIFVMNHQSHMDIPLHSCSPNEYWIRRQKRTRERAVIWQVMREADDFVDRSNPQKAIASLAR